MVHQDVLYKLCESQLKLNLTVSNTFRSKFYSNNAQSSSQASFCVCYNLDLLLSNYNMQGLELHSVFVTRVV